LIIIGIGHRSRKGKDTLAKFIIQHLRLNSKNLKIGRISFATKLKEICYDLYKHFGLKEEAYYNEPNNEHLRTIALPGINKSPVQIWIEFGTLVGREVYPITWASYALNKASEEKYDVVICPDTRFLNEVNAIKAYSGFVFKLDNPNIPNRSTIADDQLEDYTGWDEIFINDSDFGKLMEIAEHICTSYIFNGDSIARSV
jgi:hypothetical protein